MTTVPGMICPRCGGLSEIAIREEIQNDQSAIRLFSCIWCHRDFPVARISYAGRQIIVEMSQIRNSSRPRARRMKALTRALESEITDLRGTWNSDAGEN